MSAESGKKYGKSAKARKKTKKHKNSKISVPSRENKFIEFKEILNPDIHLREEKKQHLATQMKYRLGLGKGKAVYIIGFDDAGQTKGLTDFELEQTMNVLRAIATENAAEITKFEKFVENGRAIAKVLITNSILLVWFTIICYFVNPESVEVVLEIVKAYKLDVAFLAIIGFFFGGYYLSKLRTKKKENKETT